MIFRPLKEEFEKIKERHDVLFLFEGSDNDNGGVIGDFEMTVSIFDAKGKRPPLYFCGYFTIDKNTKKSDVYFESVTPSFYGLAYSEVLKKKFRSYKRYIKSLVLFLHKNNKNKIHDTLTITKFKEDIDRKMFKSIPGALDGVENINYWVVLNEKEHSAILPRGQVLLFMESGSEKTPKYKCAITFSKAKNGYYVFEGDFILDAWRAFCNRDFDKYTFLPFYQEGNSEGVLVFKGLAGRDGKCVVVDIPSSEDEGKVVMKLRQ